MNVVIIMNDSISNIGTKELTVPVITNYSLRLGLQIVTIPGNPVDGCCLNPFRFQGIIRHLLTAVIQQPGQILFPINCRQQAPKPHLQQLRF